MEDSETLQLLQRWHDGDQDALQTLIERDLPWIEQHVRRRLGPVLRAKGETQDYVQDAMIEVLEYAPRFVSASQSRFRNIVARIIENMLRDRNDWYKAKRRAFSKERPIPTDSVLNLDQPQRSVTRPSENAGVSESGAMVRLALELLEPEDRKVILLRQWNEMSFPEIGAELGITADSARMRFTRGLPRLGMKLVELRSGLAGSGANEETTTT
jgi:RNA polymerase sigma-70 factor (ECF subfamily)